MLATLATVSRRVNTRGSIQQTHLYGQKPVAGVVQRVNVDAMLATQMVEHPHLALVGRQVPKHLFARLSMPQQAQRESSCMHTAHAAQFVPPNQGQGCDTLLAAE